MKIPCITLLLLGTAAVCVADEASLSGNWHIERSAAGNQSRQDCSFAQKSSDLTGTCTSDHGPVQISGKVSGKNITWTYKGDSSGGPVTVVYKGTIDSSDKIAGTVTAVEFSIDGEFTATRTK